MLVLLWFSLHPCESWRASKRCSEEVTDGDLNHQAENRINQNFILLQRLMNHQTIMQRRRFLKKQEIPMKKSLCKSKALNGKVSRSHSYFQGRVRSEHAGQDSETQFLRNMSSWDHKVHTNIPGRNRLKTLQPNTSLELELLPFYGDFRGLWIVFQVYIFCTTVYSLDPRFQRKYLEWVLNFSDRIWT